MWSVPNQSLFQPGFCRETSWEGPFSRMVFFHGEQYIKKTNHSLCLQSLRGSYKDALFMKYWKDCCFAALTGKDVATSVEVFWPDGRSVARALEPSDMNKVMEIYYPENEEEATQVVEIEVCTLPVILTCSSLFEWFNCCTNALSFHSVDQDLRSMKMAVALVSFLSEVIFNLL